MTSSVKEHSGTITAFLKKSFLTSSRKRRSGNVYMTPIAPSSAMPSLSAKPQSFRHVPVVGVRLQLVVKTVGVLLEGHRDIGKPLLTNLLENFLKRHQVVVVLPLNPHDVFLLGIELPRFPRDGGVSKRLYWLMKEPRIAFTIPMPSGNGGGVRHYMRRVVPLQSHFALG